MSPDRLRFDFSHFSQVTAEELKKVEAIVNEQVLAGKAVNIEELPIEEAKKKGATALFGENTAILFALLPFRTSLWSSAAAAM